MKITNGSPALVHQGEINISVEGIRVGGDVREAIASIIIMGGMLAGYFLPGTWWYYWIVAFVLGCLLAAMMEDSRVAYTAEQISEVQILDVDRVGNKNIGGSLVGAAAGGVLFGGNGAIVGAVTAGNNIKEFTSVAIKFTDGEWIIATSKSDEHFALLMLAGNKNKCPVNFG